MIKNFVTEMIRLVVLLLTFQAVYTGFESVDFFLCEQDISKSCALIRTKLGG